MSSRDRDLERLRDDARSMASKTHRSYVSDAMHCIRDTGDPIEGLALLRAMWNTGHARRDNQKRALDQVGHWLENALREDQYRVSVDRILWKLGWLGRMIVAHEASEPNGRSRGDKDSPRSDAKNRRSRRPGNSAPRFGADIARLRAARERAFDLARRGSAPRDSESRPHRDIGPAQPIELPPVFEARLASFADARTAWKTAAKRRKKGRDPKDRLLAIRATSPELRPLTADIVCSLLGTDGMAELFKRAVAIGGSCPLFRISTADLVHRDGQRVVTRLHFE